MRNAIFLLEKGPVLPVDWIGCYTDDADRDLDAGPPQSGYNTLACAQACRDYTYMALRNGGVCSCGNSYGTSSKYQLVSSSKCGSVCPGDSKLAPHRYCGDNDTMLFT
jgi:hypothetical protein